MFRPTSLFPGRQSDEAANGFGKCGAANRISSVRKPVRRTRVSGYIAIADSISLFTLSFSGGRNIFRAGSLQDFLCSLGPLGVVRVHREQYAAILHATFVAFGFVLRDSHTNQGTRESTHRTTDPSSCECRHDRSCSNEGSKTWNCQCPDTGQPSQTASEQCPCSGPGGGAFWSFRLFLMGEVFGACVLGKQY